MLSTSNNGTFIRAHDLESDGGDVAATFDHSTSAVCANGNPAVVAASARMYTSTKAGKVTVWDLAHLSDQMGLPEECRRPEFSAEEQAVLQARGTAARQELAELEAIRQAEEEALAEAMAEMSGGPT